jgi:hypothetical protein
VRAAAAAAAMAPQQLSLPQSQIHPRQWSQQKPRQWSQQKPCKWSLHQPAECAQCVVEGQVFRTVVQIVLVYSMRIVILLKFCLLLFAVSALNINNNTMPLPPEATSVLD